MRTLHRLAFLALGPLATGCVVVKHMHVAEGVSALSYRDRRLARAEEVRAGFAVDALPTWAFAVSGTWPARPDEAAYFEPKCFTYVGGAKTQTGCHPKIMSVATAVDVAKRWQPTRLVHPLVSAAIGRVRTGNTYANSSLPYRGAVDSMRTSALASLGGGGELNVTSWLHLTVTAGYREVFGQRSGAGVVSPSGFTLTSLVLIGKPYR
jgi:hypothetical protein